MNQKTKKGFLIPELASEIDEKLDVLTKNPDYFLRTQKKLIKQVDSPEHLYSWWLEHPEFQKQMLSNPKNRKNIYKIAR